MDEIFARTELLIGAEGIAKLKKSHVAIAGVGGVGSYAAEAMVRTEIGYDSEFSCIFAVSGQDANINRKEK